MNKKKIWLIIPALSLPYLALFMLATIFFSAEMPFFAFVMETLFRSNALLLIAALTIYCMITLAVSVGYFVIGIRKGWDALALAKCAMLLKLAQVPAYVAIFVLGVLLAFTIFTIPFSIGLWLLDCVCLLISGLFMLAAAINSVRQGVFSAKGVRWFVILQLIFCADVVASVVFYLQLRKNLTR